MKYYFEVIGFNGMCESVRIVGLVLDMGPYLSINEQDMPDTIKRIGDTIHVDKGSIKQISKEEYDEKGYGEGGNVWHN